MQPGARGHVAAGVQDKQAQGIGVQHPLAQLGRQEGGRDQGVRVEAGVAGQEVGLAVQLHAMTGEIDHRGVGGLGVGGETIDGLHHVRPPGVDQGAHGKTKLGQLGADQLGVVVRVPQRLAGVAGHPDHQGDARWRLGARAEIESQSDNSGARR